MTGVLCTVYGAQVYFCYLSLVQQIIKNISPSTILFMILFEKTVLKSNMPKKKKAKQCQLTFRYDKQYF